ncbi:MAG: galactokinase [Gaiellaceae bacterium]|jgi:galactokinase
MSKHVFWAPGRVNLIGEFTDLSNGPVLPVALDLGIRIEAEPAGTIALGSHELGGQALLTADGTPLEGKTGSWARYVAAVASELAMLGRPPIGLKGEISSTLPIGAGLSSSAALEVAFGLALCSVADFPLEPLELAQAARRAEHRAVGVPCGILDQAAAVLGRAGYATLLETGTLAHEYVLLPEDIALVIIDSSVSRRRLESSGYATRREELERALTALDNRDPRGMTLAEVDKIAAAEAIDPVATRRLRHVVSESERVYEVARLLRAPSPVNLEQLGEVFREGHESIRNDWEATIPETDLLVELAYENGALAARQTGGGFGGAVVALAWVNEARTLADVIVAAYGSRTGTKARAYICRASGGARELS